MYERFTDRARKVLQLAQQEAVRFSHEYVGTEHVLLRLLAEGYGVATNVLKNLDIEPRKVRAEVEKAIRPGHKPGTGQLPHTPFTDKAIEYAIEETQHFNHQFVGTEHLLLGLLRASEGIAAQVLTNLGLDLDDAREEVKNLLGHGPPRPEATSEPVVASSAVQAMPKDLSDEQLQVVRKRIQLLTDNKEAFVADEDYEQAATCRDEEEALTRLLAWYAWGQSRQ